MRKPCMVANWKMHKTVKESVDFVYQLSDKISEPADSDVIIAPPFTSLYPVAEVLRESAIHLSAQNLHWDEKGAYTGEVSAGMLVDVGCKYVIIGHSERRTLFNENDEDINRKIKIALKFNLRPIFCIGETSDERESGKTFAVIQKQLKEGLIDIASDDIRRIIFAYEPVWAIGTGRTAAPDQAGEVHSFIRNMITEIYGTDVSGRTVILYGGSVNPDNIADLMSQADVDGALVGGASLDVEKFIKVIKF